MTFNDTQGSAVTTRAIDALASLELPALSAQEVLERSGLANLVVLIRVRMGLPPETFASAAQPLIERYAGIGISNATGKVDTGSGLGYQQR
jgi:hypothetical protein